MHNHKALVIGISEYQPPITRLPAVAADVREIAKLLASDSGSFDNENVLVLSDSSAGRQPILAALDATFLGASTDDTLFVYLAGHGAVEGDRYFFVAHDSVRGKLAETGVPLSFIKDAFDKCPSARAFLWLDFCHSGGILVRSTGATFDDREIIERTLKVVRGQGKVIFAACTSNQSAYEDSTIGHGLFTAYLLRGLRGDAIVEGEVTSNSLFDFIDRQMGSARQRPMQFGQMTGRIVLMHYGLPQEKGLAEGTSVTAQDTESLVANSSGMLVLLNGKCFEAESVEERDAVITVVADSHSAVVDAAIRGLRSPQNRSPQAIGYAHGNDAMIVRVKNVDSRSEGGMKRWVITLIPEKIAYGGSSLEATIVTSTGSFSPDELARLRASRILLNDPPYKPALYHKGGDLRASVEEGMVETAIQGIGTSLKITSSGVREICSEQAISQTLKLQTARLTAVFQLIVGDVVEHVQHLAIGPLVRSKVHVKFLGTRLKRYANAEPAQIEIEGDCPLP